MLILDHQRRTSMILPPGNSASQYGSKFASANELILQSERDMSASVILCGVEFPDRLMISWHCYPRWGMR
jgi:hypothetical protein